MKPEYSGQNLSKKSRTNRDLKWNKNYFIFKISIKYFHHSMQNKMELTALYLRCLYFDSASGEKEEKKGTQTKALTRGNGDN